MEEEGRFSIRIACVCGLREAVVATYIYNLFYEEESVMNNGKCYVKVSQRMITAALPFLSIDMVQNSINKLKRKGIIKTADLNEDHFDRTNWYTFTDYGDELMLDTLSFSSGLINTTKECIIHVGKPYFPTTRNGGNRNGRSNICK